MSKLSRRQSVPQFNTYQKYKPYLREDFHYRCVYCTIHENEYGGPRGFTVEHFRPKSLFPHLAVDYQNLLYGCNVCNPYKLNDWPSDDPLGDGIGYLDPCEHDYDDHFRLNGFEIEGLTQVAKYMIERLHLNRSQLVKLRKSRIDEEESLTKIIQELNEQLNIINMAVTSEHLPPSIRQQFQTMRNMITERLHHEMGIWHDRWKPRFDLDDYR